MDTAGLARTDVAYAEVNHSKWIVRCPTPYCYNAVQVWIGTAGVICQVPPGSNAPREEFCGRAFDIVWPREVLLITNLLAQRPSPANRNWIPGETVDELLQDNVAHGVIPPEWHEITARTMLLATVEGGAIGGLATEIAYTEATYRMLEAS